MYPELSKLGQYVLDEHMPRRHRDSLRWVPTQALLPPPERIASLGFHAAVFLTTAASAALLEQAL